MQYMFHHKAAGYNFYVVQTESGGYKGTCTEFPQVTTYSHLDHCALSEIILAVYNILKSREKEQ